MFLKFLVVILLLGLLASLFSGFYFLMVDQGDKEKHRTFNSLGVRVSLAIALMAAIIYGVASGQFKTHQNPWERSSVEAPTGD